MTMNEDYVSDNEGQKREVKQFTFTRNRYKRDDTLVRIPDMPLLLEPSRSHALKEVQRSTIRTTDGTVSYKTITFIRSGLGRQQISEHECKDGLDCSGADEHCPYQICWDGEQYMIVPYQKFNERTKGNKWWGNLQRERFQYEEEQRKKYGKDWEQSEERKREEKSISIRDLLHQIESEFTGVISREIIINLCNNVRKKSCGGDIATLTEADFLTIEEVEIVFQKLSELWKALKPAVNTPRPVFSKKICD